MQEKPFRVLAALAERPGELVTRAELREQLWPDGTVVDFDNNLNSAVATLRTAFGDTARSPRVIQTLPRLGYRLIAEVSVGDADRLEERSGIGAGKGDRRFDPRWIAAATGVILVLLAAAFRVRQGAAVDQSSNAVLAPLSSEVVAPEDPASRQAWQRGLYLLARGSEGDLPLALEAFEETRRMSPRFAPAHVKVSETLADMSFAGDLELRQGLTRAREVANQALALDPASASAYRVRALADLHLDWDFEAASGDLDSALRLDPRDARNYLATATILSAVNHDEAAILAARRAVELDPASSLLRADLNYFLLAAGHYAEALAGAEELLEIEPDSIHVLITRIFAAERLGLYERSLASARRIMELGGADEAELRGLEQGEARDGLMRFRSWRLASFRARDDPSHFRLAVRQAAAQQKESALDSLQQAYARRAPRMVYLHTHVQFDDLLDDPRFIAFARKLGFPQPTDAVIARIEKRLRDVVRLLH